MIIIIIMNNFIINCKLCIVVHVFQGVNSRQKHQNKIIWKTIIQKSRSCIRHLLHTTQTCRLYSNFIFSIVYLFVIALYICKFTKWRVSAIAQSVARPTADHQISEVESSSLVTFFFSFFFFWFFFLTCVSCVKQFFFFT